VMETLGNSEFNRFWLDEKGKKLAMQACGMNDKGAKRVADNQRNKCWKVSCLDLVKMIYTLCGWNRNKLYWIEGNYYQNEALVEFKLEEAVEAE